MEWLVWTFQFDLNDVKYQKAGKFVARRSLFKVNETGAIQFVFQISSSNNLL